MDSPRIIPEAQTLTPSSSGRRRISFDSSSPEFEFWMVRNPSYPEPNLHSADELFVDGFLLPLHLLSHHQRDPPLEPEPPNSDPEPPPPRLDPEPEPGPGPKITAESTAPLSASKRWRDIFKKGDKKSAKPEQEESKDKDKKKERKSGAGSGSVAELNINIWPFSRSRSAGNACTRPKTMFGAPGSRKVNSAPCSRSNSAGESKSRKWPTSPGRAGVHLGRSSPVWQVRRGGSAGGSAGRSVEPLVRNAEKGAKKDAPESHRSKSTATVSAAGAGGGGPAKAKVLNVNVPVCIGYRNHLSCRSDENSALSVGTSDGTTGGGGGKIRSGGGGVGGSGGGGRGGGVGSVGNGGNLFNLRSLFTKKVY
ncbi:serine/arginine repetitive matrix-like protein [Trema orientale]|uniref:Serine/arginine repetitive matrix-like protein n=1 Tax=Trema orientale TaxID=63057 RepID=A0A2P5F0J0_TREOI|nr:serine/arginine repetitive matrix-like protein [Trema orientale]